MGHGNEIALRGRLTLEGHERFRQIVDYVAGRPGISVTLDLAKLEFIDSSGLGMLLLLRENAGATKSRFTVKGAAGQVQRLLSVSRLDTLLQQQP